jgi:O-antigen ligase
MTYLILIFCLLFATLVYRQTNWAIYLIVAFLPSYLVRFSVLGIPMTLLEAMILILFAVWNIKNLVKHHKLQLRFNLPRRYLWPMLAVLFFATVSVFTSPDIPRALGIWKAYFIEPVLFLWVLLSIKNIKAQNILWALGISATYLSLISFWQFFSAWGVPNAFMNLDGSVDRVVSIFSYPNALGLYLGPIIVLFTGFLFWNKKFQLLKIGIILVSFLTIVLAESEGAVLAVLISWFLMLLYFKKTRLWAIVLGAIFMIIFFSWQPLYQFGIEKVFLQDYSGFIRRLIWGETWTMLSDNWLFGAGLAGYQTAIAPYHLPTFEIFLYPHNILFNFWSELGLLGLFSIVWLMITFLIDNIKKGGIFYFTLFVVMCEIIIHGLVDAPYFKNDLAILFWIIIGLSIIYKHGRVAELVEGAALEKR